MFIYVVIVPNPLADAKKGTTLWVQNMFMHIVGKHKSPDRRDAMNGQHTASLSIPYHTSECADTFGPTQSARRFEHSEQQHASTLLVTHKPKSDTLS